MCVCVSKMILQKKEIALECKYNYKLAGTRGKSLQTGMFGYPFNVMYLFYSILNYSTKQSISIYNAVSPSSSKICTILAHWFSYLHFILNKHLPKFFDSIILVYLGFLLYAINFSDIRPTFPTVAKFIMFAS